MSETRKSFVVMSLTDCSNSTVVEGVFSTENEADEYAQAQFKQAVADGDIEPDEGEDYKHYYEISEIKRRTKMGNRAVITFTKNDDAPSVYLHWNGGRASVLGFLEAAEHLGITPAALGTHERFMDAFAEMLATRFFECQVGTTVYRFPFGETDQNNYDNGVYIIDDQLHIIDRMYAPDEEEIEESKTALIVREIVHGKEDKS